MATMKESYRICMRPDLEIWRGALPENVWRIHDLCE